MPGEFSLIAERVTKRFGATIALSEVDFAVRHGEVHGLVGHNGAGKSTLVGALSGTLSVDGGSIRTADSKGSGKLLGPSQLRAIVSIVYQHPTFCSDLSVAENIMMPQSMAGRLYTRISWRRLRSEAERLWLEWGGNPEVAMDRPAGEIAVEDQQVMEIIRAVVSKARVVIFDEPTARLEMDATQSLFHNIRALRSQGAAIIYISHQLVEIAEICDRVTVLRDGRKAFESASLDELAPGQMAEAIVGDSEGWESQEIFAPRGTSSRKGRRSAGPPDDGDVATTALFLDGLGCGTYFRDVTCGIPRGGIVGIAGLLGSGAREIGEVVAGLRLRTAGHIVLSGRALKTYDANVAVRSGIGFVPGDRYRYGMVPSLSVYENVVMPVRATGGLGRVPSVRRERRALKGQVEELTERLDVRPRDVGIAMGALSGGNQQKVVFCRAVIHNPSLLVLLYPTTGVDIEARRKLLEYALSLASDGMAILLVSDDLADLRVCDRALLMSRHQPRGWFEPRTLEDSTLMAVLQGDEAVCQEVLMPEASIASAEA